jgi:hypothetical protein
MVACRMQMCSKDIFDAYCKSSSSIDRNEIGPFFESGACLAIAVEDVGVHVKLQKIIDGYVYGSIMRLVCRRSRLRL